MVKKMTQEDYVERVAKSLREARLAKEWTQVELAEKLDVHVEQISRWETGTTQLMLWSAWRLAEVLDYNMDDLYL